jgi:hypothetical protein
MATKIYLLNADYDRHIQEDIRDLITGEDDNLLREAELAAIEEMISYLNAQFDVSLLFPASRPYNALHLYHPGDYVDSSGIFYRAMLPTNDNADPNRGKTPVTYKTTDGKHGSDIYWSAYTFPNIKTYDAAEAVAAGDYRVSASDVIWKALQTSTGQSQAENAYWTLEDPRNPKLVEMCVKLALYKVHARISPDTIPTLRKEDHDFAIDWLDKAASGKISPLLPRLDTEYDVNKNTVLYGGDTKKRPYTF